MTDTELRQQLRTVLRVLAQVEGSLAMGGRPESALVEATAMVTEVESELDERVSAEVHETAIQNRILENPERCKWVSIDGFSNLISVVTDGEEKRLVIGSDLTVVVPMDFPKQVERSLDLMGMGSREELELLIDRLEEHRG